MHNIEKNKVQEVYPCLDYAKFHNISLPFNNQWNNIGISVSGGADSALLAYLLSTYINTRQLPIKIHFISNIRMWETRPWQRYDSIKVFETIKQMFPSIEYERHENFIAPEIETGTIGKVIPDCKNNLKGGDQISTMSFANYICRRENIDAWYAGITKNPPIKLEGAPEDRNKDFKGNIEEIIALYKGLYILHPFKFHSKDEIIELYKNLPILSLLSKTRSCEGDKNSAPEVFDDLDFYSYTPDSFVPICKKCYWCKEREWALKQNNL